MNKERELLVSCLDEFQYHEVPCSDLIRTIKWLLNEPEQDLEVLKKDWVNFGRKEGYDQGFNDGKYLSSPKREPLGLGMGIIDVRRGGG